MQLMLQCKPHYMFSRATMLGQGSHPDRKSVPDGLWKTDGQPLQNPQGDGRDVHKSLVRLYLAVRLLAKFRRLAVGVLLESSLRREPEPIVMLIDPPCERTPTGSAGLPGV